MQNDEVLEAVPDLSRWEDIEQWVSARLGALKDASFSETARSTFVGLDVPTVQTKALGSFSSPAWRKLATSAFLADWASYSEPVDRVDLPRLLYVMSTFPKGFRVWFCRLQDGRFTPVGYTGWYPISNGVISVLRDRPETVTHRGFVAPLPTLTPASDLYLFNASIIPQLRRTPESARMMQRFAVDVNAQASGSLLSLTVSEDGIRFSSRFGMKNVGSITVDGSVEQVYLRT